jgi:hypothetical protein
MSASSPLCVCLRVLLAVQICHSIRSLRGRTTAIGCKYQAVVHDRNPSRPIQTMVQGANYSPHANTNHACLRISRLEERVANASIEPLISTLMESFSFVRLWTSLRSHLVDEWLKNMPGAEHCREVLTEDWSIDHPLRPSVDACEVAVRGTARRRCADVQFLSLCLRVGRRGEPTKREGNASRLISSPHSCVSPGGRTLHRC